MMHTFDLELRYDVQVSGPSARIWCAEPTDDGSQHVVQCDWRIEGAHDLGSYADAQGNRVHAFRTRGTEIRCVFQAEVELRQEPGRTPLVHADRFLVSEPFLRRTPVVRALAHRLTQGAEDDVQRLRRLFRYVVTHFTYAYPVPSRGVERLDLQAPHGDCGEMSGLLVALCRAVGIPARDETGFVLLPEKRRATEHGWAAVYLRGAWVSLDPQYASLEPTVADGEARYFLHRPDWRVSFTHGYGVPLRPRIPAGHDLGYWRDLGLPLSRASVQVLQPLLVTAATIEAFTDATHVEKRP